MKNHAGVAEGTPLAGSRSINGDDAAREEDGARACTITVYCESVRNAHDGAGFVVSWISVYSGEHNVHREDRNALSATRSLHSCTSRWRAILVTVVTTEDDDCSMCVTSYTKREIPIRFHSRLLRKAARILAKLRGERLAKSFSRTCWTLLSMPRTRDLRAAEEQNRRSAPLM